MKTFLLISAGLIGLSAFGASAAKAGSDEPDNNYRRPAPREYYHDDYECHPRRVYYAPPPPAVYVGGYYGPRYYHRRHIAFFTPFLPLPPIPFVRF